jgi:AcrR family transcriptional regulator
MEYNEKQVQIMEAAEKLFSANGFDGTSVRDIAEKAEVNLAMISYYFGSKEKLMEALFKYRGAFMTLQLETMIRNREMSSLEKIYFLIDSFIDRVMKQQCFHKIMTREQMVSNNNTTSQLIHQLKKTNQELIRQLIQEGQKEGEFKKKNIDIPLMMTTLVGTTNQLITTKHYYREINNLQSLSEEEFEKHLRKKLSNHLKFLFKAILSYEV